MYKINFITNQTLSQTSGGWSGISQRIFEQLGRSFETLYIGPINPPSYRIEKTISKLQRIFGFKGSFHFFSSDRLKNISLQVSSKVDNNADIDFFFGQTPWIQCNFQRPYVVYLDAAFPTYMEIYSESHKFNPKDLMRIAKNEETWLSKADCIFWGSQWALDEAQKYYSLPAHTSKVVWVGGNIDIPNEENICMPDLSEPSFTFISLDFLKKGGWVCVKAFQIIQQFYPKARLIIIGQRPPDEILQYPGIEYAGFLRKTVNSEYELFRSIVSHSTFMIHPTIMDTMGAVIIESGYYSCPTIAPRSFGIPELIKNNVTGILVDTPFTEQDFAEPIKKILQNKDLYMSMRRNVREYTINHLTWTATGDRIIHSLNALLK